MKRKLHLVFSFVLFLACSVLITLSVLNVTSYAHADLEPVTKSSNITSNPCCYSESIETNVFFENERVHFSSDENIVVSYLVSNDEKIVDFEYVQNGFEITSINIDESNHSRLIAKLSYVTDLSEHSLKVNIFLEDGDNVIASLYAINNEHGVFISPFSEDDARERYFDYAKETNIMTQEECESMRAEFWRIGVSEETTIENFDNTNNGTSTFSTTSSQQTVVKGTLRWIDDSGVNRRLRGVMIKIYDKKLIGYSHLGTVYSDNNGDYVYAFDDNAFDLEIGGKDIFLRIYAGDTNAIVKIGDSNDDYYYESSVYEDLTAGTVLTRNFAVSMISDLGKAFQISQAILTARDYARVMMNTMPSDVTIKYPNGNICEYYYNPSYINITGTVRIKDTCPHSYASWDVIMHEYGHHMQNIIGHADNPAYKHNSDKNDADVYRDKDIGIRLAWAESWPTIFGMMAQQYYISHLSGIETVGDSYYQAYNVESYDLEMTSKTLGEACEDSIMAVLWDLYDSNADTNDTINLGHSAFWSVTTSNQSKTFSEFINYFYEMYPSYIDDIGPNLTFYQMATTIPLMSNSSTVSLTVPPKFYWTPQGGSIYYKNNTFSLVFYNSSGTEILRTPTITAYTYTLTQSEWNTVLNSYGTTYTVAVSAIQTDYPTTGEYISVRNGPLTKPVINNLSEILDIEARDRYTEDIVSLYPGQYIDYSITFEVGGIQSIQTFGQKDTMIYLYNSNGVLLDSDDDSGYNQNAFLSYNFTQGVIYKVRVKFYNSNQTGEIKLAIMPTTSLYSTYENIHMIPQTSDSYTGTLPLHSTQLLRYSVSLAQTVAFRTDAEFDAYLYLIDPRSTLPISSSSADPSVYDDDDYGDRQAEIIKTLDQSVPYLLIMSAYDPSTQSGSYVLEII